MSAEIKNGRCPESTAQHRVLRVLFLCTGNSARSQIAEVILNRKGRGRFEAHSAGSNPAPQVNPYAIRALAEDGIEWAGHEPQGLDGLDREPWDFVITVCDNAREVCPVFPGQPILSHWGMPDPVAVKGDDEQKRLAFRDALTLISRRIDLLVVLPVERLDRLVLAAQMQANRPGRLSRRAGAAGGTLAMRYALISMPSLVKRVAGWRPRPRGAG